MNNLNSTEETIKDLLKEEKLEELLGDVDLDSAARRIHDDMNKNFKKIFGKGDQK